MKAKTVSNLRSNLRKHLDDVSENSDVIIIPRNNNEDDAIVIMSIREYNSIKETEYLMSSEANRERLLKSINELKEGKTKEVDMDQILSDS